LNNRFAEAVKSLFHFSPVMVADVHQRRNGLRRVRKSFVPARRFPRVLEECSFVIALAASLTASGSAEFPVLTRFQSAYFGLAISLFILYS
jgi:hypothetical protein